MIRLTKLREFFSYTEFDGAILTKTDADAKGGSAISISYITSKPIIYLGVGQGYDDIIKFNRERFVETIFNNGSLLDSHRGDQTSLPDKNYVAPEFEEANIGKHTVNPFTGDIVDEKSPVFDRNFVTEDGPDSEILLASNRPETLPDLDKESMNDKLKIDSSSSFNTLTEQQEPSSDKSPTKGIEKISTTSQEQEEEKKEQGEKKSRFGWFKKKK